MYKRQLTTLSACAFIRDNTIGLFEGAEPEQIEQTEEADETALDSEATSSFEQRAVTPTPPRANDVEIIWEIPKKAVEGFVIHYGTNGKQLSEELQVLSAELEKFDHPEFGPVYRYYLRNQAPNASLFVSISAFDENGVSDPSAVMEVK